jgi:glycosyltransferase involved in cell wall biosynthesis
LSPVPDLDALVAASGLRRIHMLAWRDLEDVEAGGAEIHAHEIARRWAQAGLDVTMRSSYAQGHASVVRRDGYRVIRRAGRYLVFPRAILSEAFERHGPWDAVVEIWNGVPFFSPLWTRGRPSVVFLHHVHAEMWRMVMPENERLARAGELLESRIAPPFYRRAQVVTLSQSSKHELVHDLHFRDDHVTVVEPGVDPRFSPGGERAGHPLVVAVGRLVPVKRYDVLIRALARLRERHPSLEAVIVGEGYERPALEALRAELGAESWLRLPGRISDDEVVALYRRAWVLTSASAREGWGMTITEAAACGTPAVVTRIAGHADAVVDGESGLLAAGPDELERRLDDMLGDDILRKQLSEGALARGASLTWDATAARTFEVLAREAARRRRR